MCMLKPSKTIALCHIKAYFVSFIHQTTSKSSEIARPLGDRWLVMVVTRKYHDPARKPPPLFCLMLACRKGGRICGILRYMYMYNVIVLIYQLNSHARMHAHTHTHTHTHTLCSSRCGLSAGATGSWYVCLLPTVS